MTSEIHSVKQIWEKTITRFQQRTGQTLDGTSRGPDDLRRLLDAHYAAQADSEDVSRRKEVGFQIIHCIQLLGGIASQGASMVFPPSSLCFNALSFLLDIPKKVHAFHDEIDAVFFEVGPALSRFRIYERMDDDAQIDETLRLSIDQVMMSFVDLCADCINVHREGRWRGFKRSAKRILLDDGAVQSELARFKQLTLDQLNLQATLTLETATETGRHVRFVKDATLQVDTNTRAIRGDVSGLVEAEHRRRLDDERRRVLASIRAKLGQKDEEIAALLEARETMWKGSLKDSAKWLNNVDVYKRWMDRSSANSLLMLTGEPGTGKSFLVAAIAQEIKSANIGATERSLIGYYHFSVAERPDRDGTKRQLEAAITSICVQLAEQDAGYARRVSTALNELARRDGHIRDASCGELWTTLGVGIPSKNTAHYILLDSVQMLSGDDRERLWRAIQGDEDENRSSRVRVLLSGEPGAYQGGQFLASASRMKTIDITRYNEVDVKAFIVEEMTRAALFQGADQDSIRRRSMVQERLLARSNHSYAMIQRDLRKVQEIIASGGTEEELNRALHESSTDPQELVQSDLTAMEAMLKPRELEEINELLIWVVAAGFITLEEIAAALFLRFKAVSLQSLDEKITGKYSKLFSLSSTVGGQFLALKDHVEDCVVAQRDRPRQSVDEPKITATISITNGDLRTVQRFFWDLNQHSFLDGFSFDRMAEQTDAVQRRIQVNIADAHLEILKRAFDFFLAPHVDERGKAVGKYLMRSLTFHLKALCEVDGFDELLPADKHFIGSHVYGMFTDGDLIERNWRYFRRGSAWYCDDRRLDICWRWLDDPVSIAALGPRDKRWLADLKKSEDRNRSLLTPVMTMIARKWLQDTEWDAFDAYRWIGGFLGLGSKSEQHSQAALSGMQALENSKRVTIDKNDSRVDRITKAEQWSRQVLGITERDHTWYIRLGDTYSRYDEPEAASKHYKKAAAILRAQEPVDKEQLRDVFKSLGDSATDSDTAMGYWEEAFKLDDEDVDILYALLQQHVTSKKQDKTRSIIQKALTRKVPGENSTMVMAMLQTAVSKQNESHMVSVFKAIFSLIFSYPVLWTTFQEEMQAAIDAARNADKNKELATLLLIQGSAEYYSRDSPGISVNAAGRLRECLDTIRALVSSEPSDQDRLHFIRQNALICLSMIYLETAIHSDGEESDVAAESLHQIHASEPTTKATKSALASLYAFKGQRDKARGLFRGDMVETFNILVDNDAQNDGHGLTTLRTLLCHTGDYENASRAAFLYPKLQFDTTILKALLSDTDPSVTADLVAKYENHQLNQSTRPADRPWYGLQYVWAEASRRATEAKADSQQAVQYDRVERILAKHERGEWWGFRCTNCDQPWDQDHGLYACKYCCEMDLCGVCWGALRSGETGRVFVCSRTHEWYELSPWTTERYLRACREMVLVEGEVSVSKWLGMLCDEWGLDKADWGFE